MTILRLSAMRTVLKKKLKLKKGNGGEGQILTNISGEIYQLYITNTLGQITNILYIGAYCGMLEYIKASGNF